MRHFALAFFTAAAASLTGCFQPQFTESVQVQKRFRVYLDGKHAPFEVSWAPEESVSSAIVHHIPVTQNGPPLACGRYIVRVTRPDGRVYDLDKRAVSHFPPWTGQTCPSDSLISGLQPGNVFVITDVTIDEVSGAPYLWVLGMVDGSPAGRIHIEVTLCKSGWLSERCTVHGARVVGHRTFAKEWLLDRDTSYCVRAVRATSNTGSNALLVPPLPVCFKL